jgi:hypothetical protein
VALPNCGPISGAGHPAFENGFLIDIDASMQLATHGLTRCFWVANPTEKAPLGNNWSELLPQMLPSRVLLTGGENPCSQHRDVSVCIALNGEVDVRGEPDRC